MRVLSGHGVAYVVIGGYAAGLQRAVWLTKGLDVLVQPSDDNLSRIVAALDELDGEFDTPHQPPIRPTLERLRTLTGPLLIRTKHGRLDVLRDAAGDTYATVMADHDLVTVAEVTVTIASLPAILRMKRAANREKDRKVLAIIEAALAERKLKKD